MIASRPKIGVLTFHRCINYGSYWQARCLVEGLGERGFDAELLDHRCAAAASAEWRCAFQPALPARTPRATMPALKAKARKFVAAFDRLPLSPPFPLDDPARAGRYDAVVVGSDEVWNFRHPWYGSTPLFFGAGLDTARLVSYAASFGNHDAADGIDEAWSARLRRFSAVSVRDENSRRLLTPALGAPPALVLDPCLRFADRIPADPGAARGRYALVYGHGFPAWLQAAVRRWSERTGTRLLSIGYANDWADEQEVDAGPLDFARRVAGAEAVVTNFFHGCVFALVRDKPFVGVPTPYRFNKVRDLAAALGAERHLVADSADDAAFDALLGTPPAPAVHAAIDRLRTQSDDYLATALG